MFLLPENNDQIKCKTIIWLRNWSVWYLYTKTQWNFAENKKNIENWKKIWSMKNYFSITVESSWALREHIRRLVSIPAINLTFGCISGKFTPFYPMEGRTVQIMQRFFSPDLRVTLPTHLPASLVHTQSDHFWNTWST